MILNNPPRPAGDRDGGPCYRCVFPKPPPANSIVSCADGGILGPVVGTMGVLQALEAIKVITTENVENSPSLLIFSAYSTPPFRSIRLRSRRTNCAVCSADATVDVDTIMSGSTDYVAFCGSAVPQMLLSPDERVSPAEYNRLTRKPLLSEGEHASDSETKTHIVVDVRERVHYEICHLDNSINIPISRILGSLGKPIEKNNGDQGSGPPLPSWFPIDQIPIDSTDPIYVVCRLGNDSQIAVKRLKELGLDQGGDRFIGDIRGGLRAWRQDVDPTWPEY